MRRSPENFIKDYEATQAAADPVARGLIEAMMGQLLIVLVNRLGGDIEVPVSEVDATGSFVLSMSADQDRGMFRFKVAKKD